MQEKETTIATTVYLTQHPTREMFRLNVKIVLPSRNVTK